MPTIIVVVTCLSVRDEHLVHQASNTFLKYGEYLISQIHAYHDAEEICILAYDGNTNAVVMPFTRDTQSLCSSLTYLNYKPYTGDSLPLFPSDVFSTCFTHVEETLGRFAHSQIIILTDLQHFEEKLYRIRANFPAKVHIFCLHHDTPDLMSTAPTNNTAAKLQLKQETMASDNLIAATTKEKTTNMSNSNRIELLAQMNNGTYMTMFAHYNKTQIKNAIHNRFILHNYNKYRGYIAYGHLLSSIELHPDPNLTLWGSLRSNLSLSSSSSFNTAAGTSSGTTITSGSITSNLNSGNSLPVSTALTDNYSEQVLPHVLNIVAFVENDYISSPKCISKHAILPYTAPQKKKRKTKKQLKKKTKKKLKKSSKASGKEDAKSPVTTSSSITVKQEKALSITNEPTTTSKKKKKKAKSNTKLSDTEASDTGTLSKENQKQLGTNSDKEKSDKQESDEESNEEYGLPTDYIHGKKLTQKELETKYGANRKIIKADACKADTIPGSNFYELLHTCLMDTESCAVVRLNDDYFGYIAVVHDPEKSGLILCVLDSNTNVFSNPIISSSLHSINAMTSHSLIASSNSASYPWLRDTIEHMVLYTAYKNVLNPSIEYEEDASNPLQDEECNLLNQDVHPKIYNYNLKSTKTIIPFIKKEALTADFQKLYRTCMQLPNKLDLFYAEIEKLRFTSMVYMNHKLISSIIGLINEQKARTIELIKSGVEDLDSQLLNVIIFEAVVQQLENDLRSTDREESFKKLLVPDITVLGSIIEQKKKEILRF